MYVYIEGFIEFTNYMKQYEFNKFSDEALRLIYEYLEERNIFNDLRVNPYTINEVFHEYWNDNNEVTIVYSER
jgi:hypothetical protein